MTSLESNFGLEDIIQKLSLDGDNSSSNKPIEPSVTLNKTFDHKLKNLSFDILSQEVVFEILKDGRCFSHFIEKWLANNYPLIHITGCKKYDFIDNKTEDIKYDEKTFTKNGCYFLPSNMIGAGRKVNIEEFEKKAKELIYILVSNVNLPEIKVKFIKGSELLKLYPSGRIHIDEHDKVFDVSATIEKN